jgi:predicted metal-binding protein
MEHIIDMHQFREDKKNGANHTYTFLLELYIGSCMICNKCGG